MKACVVCVDENSVRAVERRQILEDAGVVVLSTCRESDAIELLGSHRVHAICLTSQDRNAMEPIIGRRIKSERPEVPVILINDVGETPAHFEEYADIVIDGRDFEATTKWLIEELKDSQSLFFVRWFVNWMRRPPEFKTEESYPVC